MSVIPLFTTPIPYPLPYYSTFSEIISAGSNLSKLPKSVTSQSGKFVRFLTGIFFSQKKRKEKKKKATMKNLIISEGQQRGIK